jgi:uncharacterized repeat protein (TIGR01451 family)
LRLEYLEQRELLAIFTVTSTADSATAGSGTLRRAIIDANATPGPDTIKFDIGGSGVRTIVLGSALPAITDPVTIDGTTQPGFLSQPLIELNGAGAGTGADGLQIAASDSVIKGLTINRFNGVGIRISASRVTVQGCLIGTNTIGTAALGNGGAGILLTSSTNSVIGGTVAGASNLISGNGGDGIQITGSSTGNIIRGNVIGLSITGGVAMANAGHGISITSGTFNTIGGELPAERNIISGNAGSGVFLAGASTRSNLIQGNYIGTDISGNTSLANGGDGVSINGSSQNAIGGATGGAGNLISGNQGAGIRVVGGPNTSIQGNRIGTTLGGLTALGNQQTGIEINGGDGSQIGGTFGDAGNIIAFNGAAGNQGGVRIISGINIPILSNSIDNNFGLGIALGTSLSPTPNDVGDGDTGPNQLQNYPVLERVVTAAGRTLIQGTLSSTPNTAFTIQFFSSPTGDPSGHGEGRVFLGSIVPSLTTDGSGNASFSYLLNTPTSVGHVVTATATDPAGNTSEFSAAIPIAVGQVADLEAVIEDAPDPATLGSPVTYTIRVRNNGPEGANGVRADFVLPLPFNFVSASSSQGSVSQSGRNVRVNLGSLAAGGSATITVIATPTSTGDFAAVVNVTSNEIDQDTSNNQATAITTVNVPADLSVLLTADPLGGVTVGGLQTFVAVVNNFGPGPATNVVVTHSLPAGTQFVSAESGQGSFDVTPTTVTFNIGTLNPGATGVVTLVRLAPTTEGILNYGVQVRGEELDTDLSNNAQTINVPVIPSADLQVSMTASPSIALVGQPLTYTIPIVNLGPSAATNVKVSNLLPSSLLINSVALTGVGGTVAQNGQLITATIPSLTTTDVGVLTIVVTPQAAGEIFNEVSIIESGVADPNSDNNTSSLTTLVSPADLQLLMTAAPNPVGLNSDLTYTISYLNNGPAAAPNVVVDALLPSGATLQQVIAPPGAIVTSDSATVNVKLGTVGNGSFGQIQIVVRPTISAIMLSTATISSDSTDPNFENNLASAAVNAAPADLGLTVTSSSPSLLAGSELTYTAIVVNNGPFTATSAILTNVLPANVEYVRSSTTKGTVGFAANTVTAQLGDLANGEAATVTIVVKPRTEGTLVNTFRVMGTQLDPNPDNDMSTVTTTVTNAPGTLSFAMSNFQVNESAGQAIITVNRSAGTKGIVNVNYAAAPGTAVNGVNFTATSGTLTFADGETSKTFSVAILQDGVVTGPLTVNLSLSTATGGAGIGVPSTAVLTIINTDLDRVAPQITDLMFEGTGRVLTGVILQFSEPLDPATATNLGNYQITAPSRRGGPDQIIPVTSVIYNDALQTVTLRTSSLPYNQFIRTFVAGTGSTAITDVAGNVLDGDFSGTAGGNFIATLIRSSSTNFTDRNGDTVSFRVNNGGYFDLYRGANNEGQVLRVYGTPRRSTLTGSVRRNRAGGDGITTLRTLIGASLGGDVISRLRTPPFFVSQTVGRILSRGLTAGRS